MSGLTNYPANEIHPQVKMIIENVLERCKKEKDHGILQVPLENFLERVSYYTALPKPLISNIFESEKEIMAKVKHKVSVLSMMVISETLLKFYVHGQYPTVSEIYHNIENVFLKSMTYEEFASLLSLLGYNTKATLPNQKLLLVENPTLTFERNLFLKKMLKLQQAGTNILYLGERIINAKEIIKKLQPEYKQRIKTSAIVSDEFMLYHIVSKNGMKHYLFTNCISSADFSKWLTDIVLPTLEPNTAIVLENNFIHSIHVNQKQITEYHSKAEMLAYLKENNIPCSNNLSKAELFNLIQLCVNKNPYNSLDRLLHAYGHRLVFLPQKYEALSVIDLLWEYIQEMIEMKDFVTLILVKGYIEDILNNKISADHWNKFYEQVINTQDLVKKLDDQIEEAIEKKYKFQTLASEKDQEL